MNPRIGIFHPDDLPVSVAVYLDNVSRELAALGVDCVPFGPTGPLPQPVDLYWDPRAGRSGPPRCLRLGRKPFAVTFHGAANLSLPRHECYGTGAGKQVFGGIRQAQTLWGWRSLGDFCRAVIAVSDFASTELQRYLNVSEDYIFSIHHGLDHRVFNAGTETRAVASPYLLHVSKPQPKKNVERILNAHAQLPVEDRLPLIAVVPGFPHRDVPSDVEVVRTPMSHTQLADLYRQATAFVFPSLHETFGLPILEAMACGCPVITSNSTGCAEIASDAALLVNPRSTDEIATAMRQVTVDAGLRSALRAKGIERAGKFTWRRSAKQHLSVFKAVLRARSAA